MRFHLASPCKADLQIARDEFGIIVEKDDLIEYDVYDFGVYSLLFNPQRTTCILSLCSPREIKYCLLNSEIVTANFERAIFSDISHSKSEFFQPLGISIMGFTYR